MILEFQKHPSRIFRIYLFVWSVQIKLYDSFRFVEIKIGT